MADSKGRGISNLPIAIQDVPDAPTVSASNVGTGRAYNNGAATVTASLTTGGRPISYTVTSSPGSITASGSSPVTVTGLSSATSYTFTARGTNASGVTGVVSASSNSITATTVPQAPTIGTATDAQTSGEVSVAFTAGATGGSAITGYTVTSSPGSITATGSSSPITVSGLTNGTSYTFTVTATNSNGVSAASSASNSAIPTAPAFFSIATATGTGSSGTITFSSIPGTYKHLQIRVLGKSTATGDFSAAIQFNSDTATNYSQHILDGNGTAASASGTASYSQLDLLRVARSTETNVMGASIIDIHDYASTSKYKTVRSMSGADGNLSNTNYRIQLSSGLWMSNSAITSISIFLGSSNWTTSSTFALYGIKG